MIERMTDAQFTTYRKILKENCPDFAHGCDGLPLCADQKRKPPCIHYKDGACTQSQISAYRQVIGNAAYVQKAGKPIHNKGEAK